MENKIKIRHVPFRLLILTGGSIFIAEAIIMFFLLPNLPPLSYPTEGFLDALLLTVMVFPILHIFLFRPLILHISERRRAEENTKLAHAELNQIFQTAADGMRIIDKDFNMLRINETFASLAGINKDEAKGKKCYEVFPSSHCHTQNCSLRQVLSGKDRIEIESLRERRDGIRVPCIVAATAFRGTDGELIGIVEDFRDITERRKLEEQLLQAQKMEAIGQLAGGIAHDFNNILTAIIGYGNLLKTEISEDDPLQTYVARILASAERAANLTKGLLAFSRKQMISPKAVNLNEMIKGLERLLPSLLGEDIELSIVPAGKDLNIIADSSQIEQVLMNLATNARDAMPDGGSLTIRTEPIEFDNEFIKSHGYGRPGLYALISVADTGEGMDEETKERIFEPFFTTKEVGKGTGLGLSMVYGIIKQHDGYISVYSEPKKGTTFKIYLPLIKSTIEEEKLLAFPSIKRGTETVLIAEDDVEVRELTKKVLVGAGYKVLEAKDGEDALKVFTENKEKIHLLILDVIMPKKNGKEVYDEIKKERPNIKVIFMSGYNSDVIHKKGFLEEGLDFIPKPLLASELLRKIREILDK
jgi:PAS domain S-box-containing protein